MYQHASRRRREERVYVGALDFVLQDVVPNPAHGRRSVPLFHLHHTIKPIVDPVSRVGTPGGDDGELSVSVPFPVLPVPRVGIQGILVPTASVPAPTAPLSVVRPRCAPADFNQLAISRVQPALPPTVVHTAVRVLERALSVRAPSFPHPTEPVALSFRSQVHQIAIPMVPPFLPLAVILATIGFFKFASTVAASVGELPGVFVAVRIGERAVSLVPTIDK
mmetsp:Transcript_20386/g.57416  ORF Transcript_20386/g.57416 Transcript_20386/m.57416 type:complete len:221 (-) Transcript_20386:953-1615(-)